MRFGDNVQRIGVIGAMLLSAQVVSAQESGKVVVLPGDVSIAGASTRPPSTATGTSTAAPVNNNSELQTRAQQLQQRLSAIPSSEGEEIQKISIPGITSSTPVAYGGYKGDAGIGFGYQNRVRRAQADDTVAAAVVSFGKPSGIGVDVAFNLLDLSSQNGGGFGDRYSFSLKAHKNLRNNLAVAIGVEDILEHGRGNDSPTSVYGVITKQINLKESRQEKFSRLYLSAGVGSGRFKSENDVFLDKGSVNVFGSASLQVLPRASVFTEWTGQDLNVGFSLVPFKKLPIVVTPTFVDLTKHAGDGSRFSVGVAYQFRY